MACSDYPDGELYRALSDFAVRDAILCPYQVQMGGLVFSTLVMGGIGMALFIRTGTLVMPFIVMLLVGGVLMPHTAPVVFQMVQLLVMFVISAAPVVFLRRVGRV
jgi:hypothetical protein